ncbi:MAG TPA: c-type cytochrome [Thermoanaerobaculia bacterium]|nr:c-type cytochrome [Thermoanaerobaculia bacterium]
MHLRRLLPLILFTLPIYAQPLKNIQILTGLSRPEVQRVMNEMRAGLGVHCHYCHATDDTNGASDTKPEKARAREMIRMTMDLNARNFGDKPVVTCFTCHQGKPHPALMPPLPQAVPPEPAAAEVKSLPDASSVIQKYIAAVGRELTPDTPRRFEGTHKSPSGQPVPLTVVSAGDKWRGDIHLPDGSVITQTVVGNGGWVRDKNGVHDITPDEQAISRMSRRAFAPFYTSALGDNARVVDSDTIGGHKTWIVAASNARYWFDADSGLLLRRVVSYDSPVGRIPEQTDFDDYRETGGVKLPFITRVALVDPWSGGTREAKTIEVGTAIAASEFEKP